MLKNIKIKANRWRMFVIGLDFIVAIIIIILSICGFQDKVAIISLILSIMIAYLATIRPYLRKAVLRTFIDEIRCSAPTMEDDTASWFIRIGVINYGMTAAKACVGRIVGVWTEKGEYLKKFDPLTLFWARQDQGHTGFNPVDIQGYGDIEYLDVAQIKKSSSTPLLLRIALNLPLPMGDDRSSSPGSEPVLRSGTYYIQVAIFANDSNIPPHWFKISCSDDIPECDGPIPCSIINERPKFWKKMI